MRVSQKTGMLDAALRVLASEQGATVTLELVAREAGVSKAGLMYHFPTREALMLAIVDHAAASLEQAMGRVLDKPVTSATAGERIHAYATVAADGASTRAEYAVFAEAAYRPDLAGPWTERMAAWFELPADLDTCTRARLETARLAADGLWAAEATGLFPPSRADRAGVVAIIQSLTLSTDAL